MHPLDDNLKSMSFEDLEKRKAQIIKRITTMRTTGIHNQDMWDQLQMFLDSIILEQEERFMRINTPPSPEDYYIVVNTDPLPDDPPPPDKNPKRDKFTPVS